MICAGTIKIRSRNVVKSTCRSLDFVAVCSAFCSAVPAGLIIDADQIFEFHANEAIRGFQRF